MTIQTENSKWVVKAEWLGEVRTVFSGSLFECIAFRLENE